MLIISTIESLIRVSSKSWFLAKKRYSDLTLWGCVSYNLENIFVFSIYQNLLCKLGFLPRAHESGPVCKGKNSGIIPWGLSRFAYTLLVQAFFFFFFIGIITLKVFRLEAIKVGWQTFQAWSCGLSLLGAHGGPLFIFGHLECFWPKTALTKTFFCNFNAND